MNEDPFVAALNALGQSLHKAWQGRPAAEREAFARGLGIDTPFPASEERPPAVGEPPAVWADMGSASQPAPTAFELYPRVEASVAKSAAPRSHEWPEQDLLAAVADAERMAALSGSLKPAELVQGHDPARASQLLDRLAPNFDRAGMPGAWSWTIRSEYRATILQDMSPKVLARELQRASDLDTDVAGQVLREILATGSPQDDGVPLAARALAYDWAAAAKPNLNRRASELTREVSLNAMLDAFEHLLAEGFVGREAEVARLRAFASEPTGGYPLPVLAVTGIGGSGKSTLLAQALRPLLQAAFSDDSAPMVVSMDFDRRSLLGRDQLELSLELSRQLGLYFPEIAPRLASLREDIRRGRTRRSESSKSAHDAAFESIARHGSEFEYNAGELIMASGAGRRTLLVVLDTFEEWQRGEGNSEWPVSSLLGWLSEIGASWGLRIRAIVSGRTPIPATSDLARLKPIQLGDLGRTEAIQLLRGLGLSARVARQLAAMAGGSPLALKLAARYYRQLPAPRRSAFVKDAAQELAGVDAVLRQGLLYQRFLNHIENAEARKVAHPGLALRRVTAELIREVLAKPCNLGQIDEWAARELLSLLGEEVWLVEYARHGGEDPWHSRGDTLIHRPEIRRAMLRAMRTDPAQADRVRAVHQAAHEWYAGKDPGDVDSAAEALYHRLALATPADFDNAVRDVPVAILRHVAQSADDFERAIRVRLLDHLGRRISTADAQFLPPTRRAEWANARADELVQGGQPERALDLWARLSDQNRDAGAWHAAAGFQAQRWDEGIVQFLNEASQRHESFRYHYLLAFVARLVGAAGEQEFGNLLPVRLRQQANDPRRGTADHLVVESMYFSEVLGDRIVPRFSPELGKVRYDLLTATQYLRVKAIMPSVFEVSAADHILAGVFRPTEAFISEIVVRLDAPPGRNHLASFRLELADKIQEELPSAQILGAWSDRFAEAVVNDASAQYFDDLRLASLLKGFMSDDPEWRVPLRTSLAEAARDPAFVALLASHVSQVLGAWTPIDLRPEALTTQFRRSPRSTAMKVVEYVDRCGLLSELVRQLSADILEPMQRPELAPGAPNRLRRIAQEIFYLHADSSQTANAASGDHELRLRLGLICGLYLEWDAQRRSFHQSLQ